VAERVTLDPMAIHQAYRRGDLEALQAALGNPADFPNCRGPWGCGEIILEYAIYHSALPSVRALLELGADPNYQDHAGFPSLIAALSSARADRYQVIELLLSFGADIQQRGVNDYTPLHYAATTDDLRAIELLLAHGADPGARTRIDHHATPLEEAQILGRSKAVQALRTLIPSHGPSQSRRP
jgi:ankyrin repeat protein